VDVLRSRLEKRGTETVESLLARVNKASYEMSFKHHFDRIVVNDVLENACAEAEAAIIKFLGSGAGT
jgi:guanylate kinase